MNLLAEDENVTLRRIATRPPCTPRPPPCRGCMRSSLAIRSADDARWLNQTGLCIAIALVTSAMSLAPRPARADDPAETIVVVDPLGPHPREDEAASASVITADRAPRSAETMADLLD